MNPTPKNRKHDTKAKRVINLAEAAKTSRHKLRQLALYVAHKSHNDPRYGAIKRNKIFFYADTMAFRLWGRPLTGVEYRHYDNGPAPACWSELEKDMERKKEAYVWQKLTSMGTRQRVFLALAEADLNCFTPAEVALVNDVLDELAQQTGTELSNATHEHPGWRLTDEGQEIPYHMALLPPRQAPLSADEKTWAKSVRERLAARYPTAPKANSVH